MADFYVCISTRSQVAQLVLVHLLISKYKLTLVGITIQVAVLAAIRWLDHAQCPTFNCNETVGNSSYRRWQSSS